MKLFFFRTPDRKSKYIPKDFAILINMCFSTLIISALLKMSQFFKLILKYVCCIIYYSWPTDCLPDFSGDTEHGRMSGARRHQKKWKDTRSQEGRDGKENLHKNKANKFGIIISALLMECFTLVLKSSRWIITKSITLSFHSDKLESDLVSGFHSLFW